MGQDKALIIVSKAQGFDPTVIYESDGVTPAKFPALPDGGQGLANFNVAADPIRSRYVGKLPQATPAEQADFAGATEAPLSPDSPVTWRHPNPDPNRPLGTIKPPAVKRGGR